jgi:surfeit locus 1 family protein
MSWRFQPRGVPTIFAIGGLAVLLSLGFWQLGRREEAAALRAEYAAQLAQAAVDASRADAGSDWRRGYVDGVPDWSRHLLLMGKYMWGQPGQQLIVPVTSASGVVVLVDVGWVPSDEYELILAREQQAARPDAADPAAPPRARRFEGVMRVYPPNAAAKGGFAPDPDGIARRWRAIDVAAMASAIDATPVAPVLLIDGEGLAPDADIPDRVPPVSGWRVSPPERPHGEYAFTWFSLAFTLVGVWLSVSFRRAV